MKALVKFALGREGMEIREVPEPAVGKGQIKIEVKAAGICGSDIHSMNDERKTIMPVILGHEFVGEIVELDKGVEGFSLGDWVVALPACGSCGTCDFCKKGEPTMCDHRASIGTHMDGAMTKYLVIPAAFAFKVPDEVEDKLLMAASEPFTCCVHGIMEKIKVHPGDVAVVSGPGLMGLCCLQCLKYCGAKVVVAGLPKDRGRLDVALELGADAIATDYSTLKEKVFSLNPKGADITVETATAVPSSQNCVSILRKQGTYLEVGVFSKPVPVDMDAVMHKELVLTGTNSTSVNAWRIAMKMFREGKVNLKPLVSCQLPLEDWETGFNMTMNNQAFKVLLIP